MLEAHSADLGYALLLKHFRSDIQNATPTDIARGRRAQFPNVPVLFWSFRIMVGLGILVHRAVRARPSGSRAGAGSTRIARFCWAACCSLPLPWIAAELGWIVAEYGRQPWVIEDVLPTALGVSSIGAGNVLFSLIGFALFYSALLAADLYLLHKIYPAWSRGNWEPSARRRPACGGGVSHEL